MAIETNLIAYWECSSVNSTIGAYPATFSGGTTVGVGTGKFGDSWEFAAIADVVTLATPVPLTSAGWTVSTWGFNLRGDSNYRAPFSNGGGGVPPYGAYHFITEAVTALAGVFCGGPAFTFFSTGATLLSVAYAGWHHYAAVFNGTTVVLYVDGAAFGVAVTPASWAGSHQVSTIGRGPYATEGFAERLDDVAAWTRPLSAAEILTIYNAGVAGNSLASLLPHARLEGMWSSVVHNAATTARLEGMWTSVAHSSGIPANTTLEGMWISTVHDAQLTARLEGMWTSLVHSDTAAPPSGGGPTSQGKSLQGGGLQGGNLEGGV